MGIRARLTLWFSSLFSVVVIGLAVTAYWMVRTQAYASVDTALHVATGATAMSALHELSEHPDQAGGERDLQLVLDEAAKMGEVERTQILVREGDRVAAFKPDGSVEDLRRIHVAQIKSPVTVEGLRVDGHRLASPEFKAVYWIYAARPLAHVDAEVATVRNLLIVAVSLGLLCSTLIGNWVAGRALKPLSDFAESLGATTLSDLSVRVKVRNENDAVSQLGLRFNSLMGTLEQAFALQRRFMADASHQIRTPVSVALATAQVTSRDPKVQDADCLRALQIIEKQMLRLRRIVDDMFFLSQADTSPLRIEFRQIHLDDAISEAVRSANILAREKNQTLSWTGLQEAKCLGDVNLLTQTVLIVLDNAIKFSPEGAVICVAIERRSDDWICSVVDNGFGIPDADQARIFERFFQARRDDGVTRSGAGLGLAIARSIMESHGGRLVLASSRPGMTRFEMSIPVFEHEPESASVQANQSAVRM